MGRTIRKTAALLVLSMLIAGSCSLGSGRWYPEGTSEDGGVATNPGISLVAGLTLDRNIGGGSIATISGASWTSGYEGDGLAFNGYDDYLLLPDDNALTLADEGSVAIWLRANSHKNYAGLLHKGHRPDFTDECWTLQFWRTTGQVALFIFGQSGFVDVYSTVWLPLNLWVHVAAIWDAGTVRLYVNGIEDASEANGAGPVKDSSGGLVVGAQVTSPINVTAGHSGFDGTLDEVQVYSRALSAAEIESIYRRGWP